MSNTTNNPTASSDATQQAGSGVVQQQNNASSSSTLLDNRPPWSAWFKKGLNIGYPVAIVGTIFVVLMYAKQFGSRPGVELMVFGMSTFLAILSSSVLMTIWVLRLKHR